MNKSALQDIQQALNAIRSEIERVDDETKWAALELMLIECIIIFFLQICSVVVRDSRCSV